MANEINLSDFGQFDTTQVNSAGQRWQKWIMWFELYAEGKGVVDPAQKNLYSFTLSVLKFRIYFILYQKTNRVKMKQFTL